MGNTVSAAEIVASELTNKKAKFDHKDVFSGQEIPPECPMHAKQPPPVASECPIKHDDVNPLNMVSFAFAYLDLCNVLSTDPFALLLDATGEPATVTWSTLPPANRTTDLVHPEGHSGRRQRVLAVPEPADVLERDAAQGLALEGRGHQEGGHGPYNQDPQCQQRAGVGGGSQMGGIARQGVWPTEVKEFWRQSNGVQPACPDAQLVGLRAAV